MENVMDLKVGDTSLSAIVERVRLANCADVKGRILPKVVFVVRIFDNSVIEVDDALILDRKSELSVAGL